MNSKPATPNHAKGGTRTIVLCLLVLAGLLMLPVMALYRMHLDFRWVGAYGLALNVFAC